MTTPTDQSGRVNQKKRTRDAIVRAAADLSRTGREVTMPEIAKAALVSEATAYRYFPDLASLLREAIADQLPDPARALAEATDSADPIERVAALTRSPSAFRPARSRPCSAAAPRIFSTISVPATPRRPVEKVEVSTATSSSVITVSIDLPDISRAISKFMTSPS